MNQALNEHLYPFFILNDYFRYKFSHILRNFIVLLLVKSDYIEHKD